MLVKVTEHRHTSQILIKLNFHYMKIPIESGNCFMPNIISLYLKIVNARISYKPYLLVQISNTFSIPYSITLFLTVVFTLPCHVIRVVYFSLLQLCCLILKQWQCFVYLHLSAVIENNLTAQGPLFISRKHKTAIYRPHAVLVVFCSKTFQCFVVTFGCMLARELDRALQLLA